MAPASRKLRESLERQLGPDETDELLNLIPPDWTQLATKHDLAVLGSELRSEMADLRTELKTDMAMLRSEFGDLKGDFGRLEGTLHKELRKQTIVVVASMLTMVSFATGLAGLIITFGPPA